MLTRGDLAPDFSLDSTKGEVHLKDITGKALLIFYPRDTTPGCTKQLCAARDNLAQYNELGACVIAINYGSPESHIRFANKHNLDFPICVDNDKEVAKIYEAVTDEGKIIRTVYILDENKDIMYAKQGLPTTLEIMEALTK